MYKRHLLGKKGEEVATEYLQRNGYKILERNFICGQGEIDIIALKEDYLVFIEVKTRSSTEYGLPSESVNDIKINHMIKSIKFYLHIRNLENQNVRIDAIEVYFKNQQYQINHLKQIV